MNWLDEQITFEIHRSCQMFTGPASQTTLKIPCFYVEFKAPINEFKQTGV